MNYNVYIDGENLGIGLSKGELNQWILDLHKELDDDAEAQKDFEIQLGKPENISLEVFLYENDFQLPFSADFGKEILAIDETKLED